MNFKKYILQDKRSYYKITAPNAFSSDFLIQVVVEQNIDKMIVSCKNVGKIEEEIISKIEVNDVVKNMFGRKEHLHIKFSNVTQLISIIEVIDKYV